MSSEQAQFSPARMWRALTTWDRALLGVFALLVLLCFLFRTGGLSAFSRLAAYTMGLVLFIRLVRRSLRHIIWRLRNRLLVAYGFIALVPVLLIITMGAVLAYAVVGQVAIYMVTSELERRTAMIVNTAQRIRDAAVEARERAIQSAYPFLANRLPGVEILVEGSHTLRYPPDAAIEAPSREWGDAGGLLVKDGLMYAWTHLARPDTRVTIMMPVTSRFLASLAPNIGNVGFLRWEDDPAHPRRVLRLHSPVGGAEDPDAPRNRVPDKVNRFDIEIIWATAQPAFLWESPGYVENEVINIRTRPSAVLRVLFAQKVEDWRDLIPILTIVLFIAFLIAEASSLVIGISLTRTITSAVHDIYEGTERIKEGIFSHRIRIKGQDQLASLGESFNSMTANIERLLVVAKESERLRAELEIAREVQNQLYPRTVPESASLRLKALCNPARMVSGDYYDYQRLDGSRIAIAIGDVAGKGISAALLMATVQSAVRTQIGHCLEASRTGEFPVSTSQLVDQLNKHLYAHTTPEKYATFFLGVFNESSLDFTYTNAGHLPPILMRGGEPRTLEVNGTVVGAFPFSSYEESRIRLEPGDLLLFYTDGISEAENAYGEQFGEERIFELLRRDKNRSPEEVLAAILHEVGEWTGSPELQDDMTLLLARRV
ncbi:MAG: hypothetical protein IANPNBLG_01063 [Bryobacteraceae bacterium]|nr:hypothetical protein [Bryobacteraceae bacterium]